MFGTYVFLPYFCPCKLFNAIAFMRNKSFLMLLLIVFGLTAKANDYAKYYVNMPVEMPKATPPQIPANSVNLRDFGAKGDGLTLNTDAINRAISALAKQGGGHLIVPAGIWLTGPFALKDKIDLHLERNAVLMGSTDRSLYVKTADGKPQGKCVPLITASKRADISITGEGTIDGNGALWRPVKRSKASDVEWKDYTSLGGTVDEKSGVWYPFKLKKHADFAPTAAKQENMRNHLIRFTDCLNVLISGVTIQNSPKFHLIPTRCENVIVDGVTIRCPWNAQNGDGLDLSSCRKVLIVNNTLDVGDDGICMKAGAGEAGVKSGPCRDMLIENNTVLHAHGGFVVGSEFSGGVENIVVRDNLFSGTDTGLRFKSGIGRGGKTSKLFISGIVMTDIRGESIVFECGYIDKKVGYKDGDEAADKRKNAKFVPEFTDIHISDITCHGAKTAISAHGLPELKCIHGITIENSVFFYTSKATDIGSETTLDIKNTRFATYE